MKARAYIIATAPRSGSTLLCELLRATGIAGHPGSHFHDPSLDGWLAAYGLLRSNFSSPKEAARAVLQAAIAKGRSGGDVFALRLQGGSKSFFLAQLAELFPSVPTDAARIDRAFGPTVYLFLTREDKVAQAVSRLIAEQTGLWHRAADGSEWERLAPPAEPTYDSAQIDAYIAEARAREADWSVWFAAQNLAPHRISYETLARDPETTLAAALHAIGGDPAAAKGIDPPMAKLSNEINAGWIERYNQEKKRR